MATVKLGDIAIEAKSSNKGDKTGIRIVGLEHLTPSNVTLSSWSEDTENTFTKEFSKGDVLFGRRRAYLKKAAVAPFGGICSGDITVIRAIEDKVDPDLLPFIIQNDFLFDFAVGKSAGSLSPRVKWTHLKEFAIELPSMPEQSKLAETLWSIIETKNAYEDLINKTDELVKSQFIEMFGTEDNHPEDVQFVKLGDIATYINGMAFKPDDWGEQGLPIIRIQNLTGSGEAFNYFDGEYPEKVEVNTGDVLISWSASLGVYLWQGEKAILNQHIFKVDFDKLEIDKYFYIYAVQQKLEEMAHKSHGSTMKHIVKKEFDNTKIAYPNEELQIRFADFVKQSDKSKFALQEAIKDLDALSKKIIAENLIPAGKE